MATGKGRTSEPSKGFPARTAKNQGRNPQDHDGQISSSTRAVYLRIVRRFERLLAERGWAATIESYVRLLEELSPLLAKATWYQYRAAIKWMIRHALGQAAIEEFLALDARIKAAKRAFAAKKRLRKRIDDDVLLEFLFHLWRAKKRKRARRLANLVIATAATGLRPVEWRGASYLTPWIVVLNAKFSDKRGKANGPQRSILVEAAAVPPSPDDPTPDKPSDSPPGGPDRGPRGPSGRPPSRDPRGASPKDLLSLSDRAERGRVGDLHQLANVEAAIRETIAYASSSAASWPTRLRELRSEWEDARRYLVAHGKIDQRWRNVRIYDLRHQFSADLKVMYGTESGFVAALMGHRSTETAMTHYGKRRHGAGRATRVRPSADSVAHVTKFAETNTARLARTSAAAAAPPPAPTPQSTPTMRSPKTPRPS